MNQSIGLLLLFLLKCEGLLGLKPRLAELKVPAYTTRAVHIYITKQLVLGPSWFHYLINQLLCCLSFSFEHSIHKRMSKPLSPERKKTFLFPDLSSSLELRWCSSLGTRISETARISEEILAGSYSILRL